MYADKDMHNRVTYHTICFFSWLVGFRWLVLVHSGAGWLLARPHHDHLTPSRWLNESPNLGNVSHKKGRIVETVSRCNGELGINLAAIVVTVTLVANQLEKAHWNASMCQYQHSHWETIRLRRPNAICESCWMICIFCSWRYRGACFQFGPSVRHQSAYIDTLTGIFRKCDSANAFWTRYLENAIGWRFRIVQKKTPKRVIWRFFNCAT